MLVVIGVVACGDNMVPPEPSNPLRDQYGSWVEIQPPGTVCGNDSQYKIWANFSDTSDNLVVVFEPGGACWDYDSCTGADGVRGAANVDGLPDDHWTLAQFISPFLSRFDDTSPTKDWNMVYVPYCTGDVFTGNVVATYTDDAGDAQVTFEHQGHHDIEAVTSWLDGNFTHVPKMLVTGCSAGGVGSLVDYHFLRNGVHAAEQGYLLDDSGPIFPKGGFSDPMHDKIRQAWALDTLTPLMPSGFTLDDMGTINTALADEFPHDRLATTYFRRDDNFSLYSYERFYNYPPKDQIMQMWNSDTQLLTSLYDTRDNLYYFIPYWRNVNSSHCTTLFTFAGSDIEDHDMTLAQWVNDFVDDNPVESMIEAPVPGEDP
ncbi:MAG TPA: pectin acetylesterase-family hydrolase [Kofleriaceae bacterium]|nr:pectin acetylesterase-family hydrolase [Kofleriaceae bacterium]